MKSGLLRRVSDKVDLLTVDLSAASDRDLMEISGTMGLSLSIDEMRYLKNRFKSLTDAELQTFGQTWSEHCIHKTFRGDIRTEKGVVRSIFKSYIARATRELNKPWCVSVFEDNAGIVEFDKGYVVAAKVETHNHPSAVEPFGGAATGVGGVIRDILGVWGDPVAVTDVLCFGPLDVRYGDLPPGVKHPKYIYKGVVAGIGAYGNNMGIPNISGAILFDKGYTGNVVVYCGCIGVLPKKLFVRATKEGDYAVLAGGKTGKDGIHGVTFASADLPEESEELRSAVQIPNPVVEERLKRATSRIRDARLASGVTDLGGGGISCATGEMAHRSSLGLDVKLDFVHLKEKGMAPWEIWVSESQERMLYSVPEGKVREVLDIFKEEDVEACVLGRFNGSGRLRVTLYSHKVCNLDLDFLYSPPKVTRKAGPIVVPSTKYKLDEPRDLAEELLALLSDQNVRSREDVIRTYDHEVMGCTAVKPLQGEESGPNDAAVIKPLKDSWMGLVISCGINPFYPDPYWMAATSIEEAVRNNASVGGRRVAILDNFVWGNPEHEDRMGSLLRAVEACYDFSKALDVPFISGKDSLYNESPLGPVRPTLLITGVGIIPDLRRSITLDLKRERDPIYLIGLTKDETGGSAYFRAKGVGGGEYPKINAQVSKRTIDTLITTIDGGMIMACHDLSDGGLGVAAAEMVIASDGLGLTLDMRQVPAEAKRSDILLFSESTSRFLVEVNSRRARDFEKLFKGLPYSKVGEVVKGKKAGLSLLDLSGSGWVLSSPDVRRAWRGY